MRHSNNTYCKSKTLVGLEPPKNVSVCIDVAIYYIREILTPPLPQLILSSSKQKADGSQIRLSMLQFPLFYSIKKYVQCLNLTIRDLSSYFIVTEKLHYYSDNVHLRKFR